MKITDIQSGTRVRYVGNATGLMGRWGTVVRRAGEEVSVYWDGRPARSWVRPESLSRLHEPVSCQPAPLNDGARFPSTLPNDSEARKQYPIHDVLFGQFPAAVVAVAHHSWKGNNKHNPGLPLQDNRSKSMDDADCLLRHLAEGDYEAVAWRGLRLLQRKLEAEGAPIAPLATNLPKE